jgi:cysteine desulfurase / selenocysteine lyase
MSDEIKSQFPFFAANPNLVYLDSAATALKPQRVIDALVQYTARESVNIHRGVYQLSQRATETVESVRARAAKYVSARPNSVAIFTRGTTESMNLVAHMLTSPTSKLRGHFSAYTSTKPPAILLSESEHHANIVPWQIAAQHHGYQLFYIPVDDEGSYAPTPDFLAKISETHSIRIVSLSLQSNVTGIIHDLTPYREFAKSNGAAFVVDAAQAILHVPRQLASLDADFVAYSAHKIFGSTGIGCLVGPEQVFNDSDVYQGGGGMISRVDHDTSTYLTGPSKYEAGTQPIAEIYALGAALDFAQTIAANTEEHEKELLQYADERLATTGVRIFGSAATARSPIYSFEIPGVHAHDTGTLLDELDICVRAGHHCCQLLMRSLGVSATARASFSVYNTREDVDRLIDGLKHVKKIFRK